MHMLHDATTSGLQTWKFRHCAKGFAFKSFALLEIKAEIWVKIEEMAYVLGTVSQPWLRHMHENLVK